MYNLYQIIYKSILPTSINYKMFIYIRPIPLRYSLNYNAID